MHAALAADPEDPHFAPEEPSARVGRDPGGVGRRGDRAGLPLAARSCPALEPHRGPQRRAARPLSGARPDRPAGSRDPRARRLPPRAGALVEPRGLGRDRLRGRAGAQPARAAEPLLAAARRRRHAALLRLRGGRGAPPPRRRGAGRVGGTVPGVVPRGLPRDCRPAAAARRQRRARTTCSRCSSSRSSSTSCATSSATGPTGSAIPVAGLLQLLEAAE